MAAFEEKKDYGIIALWCIHWVLLELQISFVQFELLKIFEV